MKLLVVTAVQECLNDVSKIFNQAKISVFSITDTTGIKASESINLIDNWFASGKEKFDSAFIFSFTENENAENALQLINEFNASRTTDIPIRGFIIPVEKFN
jgi:hypothetical protein